MRDLVPINAMATRKQLEATFRAHGQTEFRWVKPSQIVVAHWVRMKCQFGCQDYGHNPSCPPNLPAVADCARFFWEYRRAVIFHHAARLHHPNDRHAWTNRKIRELLGLEREVFLGGAEKAFLLALDNCHLCKVCSGDRRACKLPRLARPTPEAMAVDVFATVRAAGFPIRVLSTTAETMNRYAILLVD